MELAPVTRIAVSDSVFAQLANAILSGEMAPDDSLPSERDLAESFQVNRHAIREALKQLRQAGLIRIAHGGKTKVLDWHTNAGLGTFAAVARSGVLPPLRLLLDIMVMRRSVAADAARLCAVNATDQQVAAVVAAGERYSDADAGSAAEADLVFWQAVFAGSGNVAYQLAQNTLVAGYADIGWEALAALGVHAAEYGDGEVHVELARRISARDEAGAHDLANEVLGLAVDAVSKVLDGS
jgi:DNA-binding FadR family transcriptional regulator